MTIELLNKFATERGYELTEEQLQYAFDNAGNIEEYEMSEDEYDTMLDEIYEEVKLGSLTFYPSQILKQCDPIAYRCGKNDFEQDYTHSYDGENYESFDDALVAVIEDAITNG